MVEPKRIKLLIISLIVFIIGSIGLKYLTKNPSLYIDIKEDYPEDPMEDSLIQIVEENKNQEKNWDIAGENFIIVKSDIEEVSRSSISRRKKATEKIVKSAHREIGKPYSYGKIGPNSYDCSGFTYYIYLNTLDIKLDRTSKDQSKNGKLVEKKELMPGDLVFFNTYENDISHVGIYIGDGDMIHASSKSKKIIKGNIDSEYFKDKYVTARRIIN